MTSQSLPNFCIELRAVGSVKFDNDCDVILLFNAFTLNPISTGGGGGGGGVFSNQSFACPSFACYNEIKKPSAYRVKAYYIKAI